MLYIMAPEKVPAMPMPAIARPTMNTAELGAAPQTRDPISKIVREHRNVHLAGKVLYRRPQDN